MNHRIRFEGPASIICEQKQPFRVRQIEVNLGFSDLCICFLNRPLYRFAYQLEEVSLALHGKLINSNPEKAQTWVWNKSSSDPVIKQVIYVLFVALIFKNILLKTFQFCDNTVFAEQIICICEIRR